MPRFLWQSNFLLFGSMHFPLVSLRSSAILPLPPLKGGGGAKWQSFGKKKNWCSKLLFSHILWMLRRYLWRSGCKVNWISSARTCKLYLQIHMPICDCLHAKIRTAVLAGLSWNVQGCQGCMKLHKPWNIGRSKTNVKGEQLFHSQFLIGFDCFKKNDSEIPQRTSSNFTQWWWHYVRFVNTLLTKAYWDRLPEASSGK